MTKPEFKMTVTHAAEHGTARDLLVALRELLAKALEDERTQPRDISALVLRLKEVSAEITALDARIESEAQQPPADAPFDPSAI